MSSRSLTGSDTVNQNSGILGLFWFWKRQTQLGVLFDSSTGFHLPNRKSYL
ncbi:hypothetical protein [Lyngbya sp. PCC 8106]|uniref:hypothetical protein n=1 Tax=Lyngbya sp. (strain PCC 8106) TaxID=313612 RepID=UPI0012E9D1B2|nr:hypothetical protein [Lyngbya sp. PCC 8106]